MSATPHTTGPLAEPRFAADGGAWTVTNLARWWACKPHAILALIKAGELRAVNIAAPNAKRPHWRIMPEDLAAFEAPRAAVPTGKPMPRKKLPAGVQLVDPATGKVRREYLVAGSAELDRLTGGAP